MVYLVVMGDFKLHVIKKSKHDQVFFGNYVFNS